MPQRWARSRSLATFFGAEPEPDSELDFWEKVGIEAGSRFGMNDMMYVECM